MPELTVFRKNSTPPPMICMYCGAAATSKREWREVNHKPIRGGDGTDLTPVPTGDDPVSVLVAILMLPFVLWQLLVGLAAAIGAVVGFINRPASPLSPPPPVSPTKPPPTMLVFVTTCDRHRHYHRRFGWAWLGISVALAGLWACAIAETVKVMGTENVDFAVVLVMTAIFATILLPMAVGTLRFLYGPVVVDRVTESTVVLDRVRQAYFEATGLTAG
jgi:hypothetical protein